MTNRKNLLTKFIRPGIAQLFLCIAALALFAACGGGGGDGDGSGGGLSEDACSTLGLKIFNGSACTPASSSPVVEFTIESFDGSTALCSGEIISSQHVLTAGHCFSGQGADVRSITVVAHGTTFQASRFAIHPQYEERLDLAAIFNDVAVIEVDGDFGIAPLPLLVSRVPAANDVIDIFGYGLTENSELGELRSGQMRLDDVTPTHLISVFGEDGSNTCVGDSGGPALMKNAAGQVGIVGITSTGSPDSECREGDVSLFLNVQAQSVLDFIRSAVPNVGLI